MANEYHDAQGRFCSKGDMQNAIRDLAASGDHEGAQKLIADLKRIEEKREEAKFIAEGTDISVMRVVGDHKEWRANGKLHRVDGPAIEYTDGRREWARKGKLHRIDGPAIEEADGSKEWWVDGYLHREDGPAIEWADGDREWWVNGRRHRTDGPAIEDEDGHREWWVSGRASSEAAFNARLEAT